MRRKRFIPLPGPEAIPRPQPPPATDESLRFKAVCLDELLVEARRANKTGKLSRAAFRSVVEWLAAEERKITAEANRRYFTNAAESDYWRRIRPNVPSAIEQQLAAFDEPATRKAEAH